MAGKIEGAPSLPKAIENTEDFIDSWLQFPTIQKAQLESIEKAATKAGVSAGKTATETAQSAWAAYDGLTLLGVFASSAKTYNGIIAIDEVWKNESKSLEVKVLTTISEGSYGTEGILKTIKGVKELANNNAKLIGELGEGLGKGASAFKIVGGSVLTTKAIVELSGEQEPNEKESSYCELFAGTLDVAGGICELIPNAKVYAIPLGTMSSFMSMAGDAFKEGNEVLGTVYIIVGTAISAILVVVVKVGMEIAATALSSLMGVSTATAATTIVLIPVVAGILAMVAPLIYNLFTSEPPEPKKFAQGGFPVYGQPFIAREAGPELVGTLNGRTAVVNNDQIVEAVSCGVYGAFRSAFCDSNSNAPAVARVFLDGKQIAMAGQV